MINYRVRRGGTELICLYLFTNIDSFWPESCEVSHTHTHTQLRLLLHHVSTVIFASDHRQLDPGQVLGLPALNQDHVVLLQVVPLPGDEDHHLLPVWQAHPGALPVSRVGLLGFPDHRLQDDAFELRAAESGARRLGSRFGLPLAVHLVEGGHGSGEEGARPGGGEVGRCGDKEQEAVRTGQILILTSLFLRFKRFLCLCEVKQSADQGGLQVETHLEWVTSSLVSGSRTFLPQKYEKKINKRLNWKSNTNKLI